MPQDTKILRGVQDCWSEMYPAPSPPLSQYSPQNSARRDVLFIINAIAPILDLEIQEHASIFNLGVCLCGKRNETWGIATSSQQYQTQSFCMHVLPLCFPFSAHIHYVKKQLARAYCVLDSVLTAGYGAAQQSLYPHRTTTARGKTRRACR